MSSSSTQPSTTHRKRQQKKWLKWGIIALVLLALAWALYQWLKPEEVKPNYITATAEIDDIENTVMASGKVKAINTVDVGAEVSGEVTKLYVDVGSEVQTGDLIAQIDQVTQQNNLSNQQASLVQSEASLQSAKSDLFSQQASLKTAYATLASRQAELKQAQADFDRLAPLININAISQQEYENARTKVETAQANVATAQAGIDTAKASIVSAESNIASQQADLQKAQTNLDTASNDLGNTIIKAPMNGTVVSVTTEQGATVNAMQSAPTIVTLADLSTVRINAQISEADVVKVSAGMPVYFNTIGDPDTKYDAVLTAIEPAPETISTSSATNSAVYYIGYIEVPNPDRKFRIDMTTQVFIVTDKAQDAVIVPSSAVLEGGTQAGGANGRQNDANNTDPSSQSMTKPNTLTSPTPKGKYVRVLKADGTVENRAVTVGIDNRVNAQILSGLTKGEDVILSESSGDKQGDERPPRF